MLQAVHDAENQNRRLVVDPCFGARALHQCPLAISGAPASFDVMVHRALLSPPAFLALLVIGLGPTARAVIPETPPPWAYGFKEPAPPGTTPATSTALMSSLSASPLPDFPLLSLPDTDRRFTPAQIRDNFGPADWYPGDHPPMPEIVAHGRPPVVWACARCHNPNGMGRPENASIAGLPVDYFIEQLRAFRNDERMSSDPRKANTRVMADFAKAMTDGEMRVAAEYYCSMSQKPLIRVVETDRVPQTTLSVGMFLPVEGGGDEPLGRRIIEVPEDPPAVEILRDPRIGFIAYAPVGSVKRGEFLVTTGGGVTVPCAACHGPDLKGMTLPEVGAMPVLAGRSPSYLVRQLFDIKSGRRHGKRLELMQPVVANLGSDDMLAVAAYLASKRP
jgi:cytochrome c553